jgi:hypothetical protein
MEENRKRARFGAKLALEAMIANGKLLKMLRDEFNYRGSAYEDFAMAHADIHNKGDAHRLYLLGTYGDVVLAQCEAEEALVSNYEWPHWRKVVRDLKREADKREKHRDDVDTSPEPEQPAPESPLDAKTRECDELQAQLTAAAQQIRSERFAKEEAQEAYDKLAAKANATILGINAARAALPGWWKEREGRLQAYEPDEGTSP